jgi:ABC-type antimicrobial peptide transport system permease subunit
MGASGRMVLWVVLRRSLRLVLGGALLGLAGAMFLARTSRALLFGVTAADAISFAVAGAIVAVVGTIAAVIPARRAARIDPVMLLRAE